MIINNIDDLKQLLSNNFKTDANLGIIGFEAKLLPISQDTEHNIVEIKGCEIPILIKEVFSDNTKQYIECYTKSRLMRAYLYVVLLIKNSAANNWQDFFKEYKLMAFLTKSRMQGLDKFWEYLDKLDKDILNNTLQKLNN